MPELDKYIHLNDRERYVLWAVACWFGRPIVSSNTKNELYPHYFDYKKYQKKYDPMIEDRIIELGKWLEKRRDEQAK